MSQQTLSTSTLQQIFKVTLEPTEKPGFVYLESLAQELQDDGAPLELSVDNLDGVIWAMINTKRLFPKAVFNYLFASWKISQDISRESRRALEKSKSDTNLKAAAQTQLDVVANTQPLIINYALLAATDPEALSSTVIDTIESLGESIPQDAVTTFDFGAHVLSVSKSSQFWDFFDLLVKQSITIESLSDFLSPILQAIHNEARSVRTQPLAADKLFSVMEHLVSNKTIVTEITQLPNFCDKNLSGPSIEDDSLLGPLFSISPLHDSKAVSLFPSDVISKPNQRGNSDFGPGFDSPEISNIYSSIRVELNIILSHLFNICDKIVRAGEGPRTKLLTYFGKVLDLNHKRTAIQVDPDTVSSSAFMINITSLLLRFCEPFVDISGSKMNKISLDYFRESPVFAIEDETAICADLEQSKEYYRNKTQSTSNFISHVFYLTIGYLHYGPDANAQAHDRINRRLDDLKNHLAYITAQLAKAKGTFQEPLVLRALEKVKKERESTLAQQYMMGAYLFDKENQSKVVDFMLFLTVFFVRVADPEHKHPQVQIKFPYTATPPEQFNYLPDYFMEIIPSYFNFVSRHAPYLVFQLGFRLAPLLTFIVVFLDKRLNIKNPYIKIKFVETLYFGSVELYVNNPGYFTTLFNTEQFCLDHLFHMLMQFYIDVERTGASSQFEDKFNARLHTAEIFKVLWKNTIYQQRLVAESKTDPDFFVRFVALLLNDATYLMDETLSKLTKIHKLQVEIEKAEKNEPRVAENEGESPPELPELQSQLESVGRMARFYVQMAQESSTLLRMFTETVPRPFVTPELVDRLAAMLDYNLDAIVGPRSSELRIKNPEKFGFRTRNFLLALVDVYLHLAKNDLSYKNPEKQNVFAKAVARDGRSYRHSLFVRAADIMSSKGLKSADEISQLLAFASVVEEMLAADQAEEEDLGDDIPDEFLDPLMYTVMKNPVTLPTSKVNIDLSTIKSHLLSDAKDPFNRMPLSIEDVVENKELKQKIENWKTMKKQQKAAAKGNSNGVSTGGEIDVEMEE